MTELAQKLLDAIRSHPGRDGMDQDEAMRILDTKDRRAVAKAFAELRE